MRWESGKFTGLQPEGYTRHPHGQALTRYNPRPFCPLLMILGSLVVVVRVFACTLLLTCSGLAQADDAVEPEAASASRWSGSRGEFGFAATRGNSSTESFNGRLGLRYARRDWVHQMDLFGLRSSARYTNTDGGITRRVRQATANRYSIGAGSAWQMGKYRQLTASIRYEHDSFASFDSLYILGVSYGNRLIDGQRLVLDTQFGPGARRAHDAHTGENRNDLIVRGSFDLKLGLTDNTELINTLLVESGSSNTFAQNDLGISVAMNEHLALKAGWQARYNSDVDQDRRNTDTLATMNVVYRFK